MKTMYQRPRNARVAIVVQTEARHAIARLQYGSGMEARREGKSLQKRSQEQRGAEGRLRPWAHQERLHEEGLPARRRHRQAVEIG